MLICLQRMDRKNINADRREKGSGKIKAILLD